MKNLFLVPLVVLFSATTIYAQSDEITPQFGVKGGVNLSTVAGDDIGDQDLLTSFHLGLFMEIPISERFSFQPEVLYSGQGFTAVTRDESNFFNTDGNVDYKLSYIQVPLMAKFYLVKGLYAEAGPQFGFKVKEEIDFNSDSDGGDIEIDSDDSQIKDFDTSLALGAGYKFDNGFSLSARYTYGLTTIVKDDSAFLGNSDIKNAVWQFGVGFSF
ncbi:outer membrane protein with beta-barrel domain [Gelidibacter algens]|uniref:Outer membrane protein with beta-barrel domain n=1 Tax=Gelidibacter algens TaxID=49280 RepID=A0A1A7R664_9FLAO|nr:porin family protein [Gelidibacter algens]OBX26964.1 hypothetical protein A9996_02570 [Gelidibacter algens]RAJ26520.1 outer membrane protein with beta-barrel domain [Gelidibacter algens]